MIETVIAIALHAGEIVLAARKEGLNIVTKSHEFDFVTQADTRSEDYIVKRLRAEFPTHSIHAEEGAEFSQDSEYHWFVDPLDGTKDFKNGGNGFSILIGLCYHSTPVFGVVYAPGKGLLYHAQKGKGAYQRIDGMDVRLHVSDTADIEDARMAVRIMDGERRAHDKIYDLFDVKEKIPSSGGAKFGMMAAGIYDFHVNTNLRVCKWDTCAPQIVLEEAGGKMTGIHGEPLDYQQAQNNWPNPFIASNGHLHDKIIKRLEGYWKE
jgi:3'(2'), 5'-bisphosphate nucleotidase